MLCDSRIYNAIFIIYFVTHTAYFLIFNIFTKKREVSPKHVSAPECHLWESTNTKSNSQLQVLIALTVILSIIKTLKFWKI
jgi:hypothetical protein